MSERNDDDLPHAVWEGVFSLGGIELKAYVLSDGRRVIDADDMAALFTMPMQEAQPGEFDALSRFLKSTEIPPADAKEQRHGD